jgi:hypothetical protein
MVRPELASTAPHRAQDVVPAGHGAPQSWHVIIGSSR